MALTQFIKELLYLNDKIIIPGFGGFVAQFTTARIDYEKNILTPTVKTFIFDSSLTEDDGIFTTFISSKKSISISEATVLVIDLVEDFKRKLREGNTLLIEEVGYLFQDDQNIIRFKRDEERNYNPENYGLNAVTVIPVENNREDVVEETYYPVKRRISVAKILVLFLILNIIGAASAFIYWKFDDIKTYFCKTPAKQTINQLPDTSSFKINPDTSEVGQHIDTSTNIKNALRYEETPAQNIPPVAGNEAEKTYYIIAGSFQSFEKAETHSKILAKNGLKTEVIDFGNNLYRISVGEYKGKDEALKQLELIKCKRGAENAWLLAK